MRPCRTASNPAAAAGSGIVSVLGDTLTTGAKIMYRNPTPIMYHNHTNVLLLLNVHRARRTEFFFCAFAEQNWVQYKWAEKRPVGAPVGAFWAIHGSAAPYSLGRCSADVFQQDREDRGKGVSRATMSAMAISASGRGPQLSLPQLHTHLPEP